MIKYIGIIVVLLQALNSMTKASSETREFNCSQPPPNMDIRPCCPIPEILSSEIISGNCTKYNSDNGKLCFAECVFNETNIINLDGQINQKDIRKFLLAILRNNLELLPAMEKAFGKCSIDVNKFITNRNGLTVVQEQTPIRRKQEFGNCSHYSRMVIECVQAETFINCPNDKWSNDFVCNNSKEFIMNCLNYSKAK